MTLLVRFVSMTDKFPTYAHLYWTIRYDCRAVIYATSYSDFQEGVRIPTANLKITDPWVACNSYVPDIYPKIHPIQF